MEREKSNLDQTRENIQKLLVQTMDELGMDEVEAIKYVTDLILTYKDFRAELYTIVEHEVRNNFEAPPDCLPAK